MNITYSLNDTPSKTEVLTLYRDNEWSSAKKLETLMKALKASHSLVTARVDNELAGLGNAISDGHLVVYYPHLLVHPKFQRMGIGTGLMNILKEKYADFHQQQLTADGGAVEFYKQAGFERAGKTVPMWIYQGDEH